MGVIARIALVIGLVILLVAPPFASHGQDLGGDTTEEAASVPEPGTLLLLGTGLVGMAVAARKRRKR